MQVKKLDGSLYKTLIISGAENLKRNYQTIDSLNVFPVPDGDTGTNMKMTIEGGVNEIYNFDDTNIYEVAKKVSRGMLMGARGNSGVILSQLFRGISKGFEGYGQVDAIRLARAFDSGVKQAYKAVMKPVEGTILTVAREATEKLLAISSSRMSINEFFKELIEEAKASLARTPELLPVLKEANVVDSGGAGFICILEGMQMSLEGVVTVSSIASENKASVNTNISSDNIIEFGYCTEFLLKISKDQKPESFDEKIILDKISPLGNSIVVVKDEDIIKVHVHTLKPGNILNIAQEYGEFIHLKIENMTIQHNESKDIPHVTEGECPCGEEHYEKPVKPEGRKLYSVVVVASGKGLVNAFKEVGADFVVEGGQSMNPSTEDFIRGFDTLNAEHIIVFPNNKNIILAANQAAKIYTESKVHVVQSKSLAQGLASLPMLEITDDVEAGLEELKDVIAGITTGLITYSVRDSDIDGVHIKKDDYIAICDSKMISSNRRRSDAVKSLLKSAVDEDKSLVTIIYGEGVTLRELNELVKYIEKNYSNLEVETIEGNQEVYSYILAIE